VGWGVPAKALPIIAHGAGRVIGLHQNAARIAPGGAVSGVPLARRQYNIHVKAGRELGPRLNSRQEEMGTRPLFRVVMAI
jgi:hypothetical protein